MCAAGVTYIYFDSTLQTAFMNIFYHGRFFTVIQNVVRTGWVVALGTDPRLGLCVCSIAMIGGLGTAALYGE